MDLHLQRQFDRNLDDSRSMFAKASVRNNNLSASGYFGANEGVYAAIDASISLLVIDPCNISPERRQTFAIAALIGALVWASSETGGVPSSLSPRHQSPSQRGSARIQPASSSSLVATATEAALTREFAIFRTSKESLPRGIVDLVESRASDLQVGQAQMLPIRSPSRIWAVPGWNRLCLISQPRTASWGDLRAWVRDRAASAVSDLPAGSPSPS